MARSWGCWWRDSNPQGLSPRDVRDLRVYRFRHTSTSSATNPGNPEGQDARPRTCCRPRQHHVVCNQVCAYQTTARGITLTRLTPGGAPGSIEEDQPPRGLFILTFLPSMPERSCHPFAALRAGSEREARRICF